VNEPRSTPTLTVTLTPAIGEDAPPRWAGLALNALFVAYGVGIAAALWRILQLPAIGDELQTVRWFARLQAEGWLASLREGDPVGHLALVRLAGGDWSVLVAGRAIGVLTNGLLGLSLWRICERLGVSPLGRRLALLTFLNLVLASHSWAFKAIADGVFTLVLLWTVIGIERAITGRRPRLAVAAGAAWAFTFLLRPLAVIYALAIVAGLAVLILRDRDRRRAIAYASLVTLVGTGGVLLAQTPAMRTYGRPVFEHKVTLEGIWAQRRYLSLLVYEQQGALAQTLRIPLVEWDEVQRYTDQHGPDALPRTNVETWRRDPWRRLRQFAINVVYRTNVYLGALLGVLYPLAWFALAPRVRDRSEAVLIPFAATVLITYTVAVNVIVSPFLEWRWILLPLVAAIAAGACALDRVSDSNRNIALKLVAAQIVILSASWAMWTFRALSRTAF
jgi:hypothetical protein